MIRRSRTASEKVFRGCLELDMKQTLALLGLFFGRAVAWRPNLGREDRQKKTSEVLLPFRALGYWAACALIGVAAWNLWSGSVRSTIVIEAGPKGGFFNDAATLLRNELRRYDIDAVIVNRDETLKIIEDVND